MTIREVIRNEDVPLSSSPVSQATKGGGFVFVGGQMPRDVRSGQIVEGARAQAELSMSYCLKLLDKAGCSAEHVMVVHTYLTDLRVKPIVDEVFHQHFAMAPPARHLVEVSAIGDGAIVEFALIAISPTDEKS